jgi:hypothetical protein
MNHEAEETYLVGIAVMISEECLETERCMLEDPETSLSYAFTVVRSINEKYCT